MDRESEPERSDMCWVTLPEMNRLFSDGLFRGDEPLRWAHHVSKGGRIISLEHLTEENAPMPWNSGDMNPQMTQQFEEEGMRGPSVGFVSVEQVQTAIDTKNTEEISGWLLSNRMDVNIRLKRDLTVLQCAVMTDNLPLVRSLLLMGADPFALTTKRRNALHYAT